MLPNVFLLDIETISKERNFECLTPDWQQLWIEKIATQLPNLSPEESFEKRAAILAEFGKVVCISTAILYLNDANEICLRIKSIYGDDEKKLLHNFILLCNKVYARDKHFQFAGHNIREFDIPYLCRRMLINHIELPSYLQLHNKKPWEVKMFDTMNWWKFGDNKNYISLDLLAHVLGVPTSKTDIDGSQVHSVYYDDNDLPRIVRYCERDVVTTANIMLRFLCKPLLLENNIQVVG